MILPDYKFEICFEEWYHIGVSHLYKTKFNKIFGFIDATYQVANDYDDYLCFAMGEQNLDIYLKFYIQ